MKRVIILCLALSSFYMTHAQSANQKAEMNAAGTLQNQYDYLWSTSNKYQNNKVVKMSLLNQFNSNVQDSINSAYELISSTNNLLTEKKDSLSLFGSTEQQLIEDLETAQNEKDAFEFLGMKTTKASFKVLFFAISGFLLALALFSLFRMRSKSGQASDDKTKLETLELEFENFKKRSREKEQVLARQLQDEINKRL